MKAPFYIKMNCGQFVYIHSTIHHIYHGWMKYRGLENYIGPVQFTRMGIKNHRVIPPEEVKVFGPEILINHVAIQKELNQVQ